MVTGAAMSRESLDHWNSACSAVFHHLVIASLSAEELSFFRYRIVEAVADIQRRCAPPLACPARWLAEDFQQAGGQQTAFDGPGGFRGLKEVLNHRAEWAEMLLDRRKTFAHPRSISGPGNIDLRQFAGGVSENVLGGAAEHSQVSSSFPRCGYSCGAKCLQPGRPPWWELWKEKLSAKDS